MGAFGNDCIITIRPAANLLNDIHEQQDSNL